MTLNDLFFEMLEFKVYYSDHTLVSKKSAYNKHIKPVIGLFDINVLTYKDLQSLLNSMLKSGYAPKTVSHIKDILKTSFDYAERLGYLTISNPSRLLELRKIDNRAFLRLTPYECINFITAVKNQDSIFWRAFFMFLLHGRRLGEVKALCWSWLDLDSNILYLPALNSKDRYNHSYAISDELSSLLKLLPRSSALVFPSPATGLMLQDVRKAFFKILDTANIDKHKMRIHDIRHLVATVSLNAGFSLEDVKYALGHRSLQTTMRYVTNDTSKSKKISNFIFNLNINGF